MKKIGLLGFGTIGRKVVEEIQNEDEYELTFVYDPYAQDVDKNHISLVDKVGEEDFKNVDLVIEAATGEVVRQFAADILRHTSFMAMSVTALSDENFYNQVVSLCEKYNTEFFVPHGAILGLDGIFDGKKAFRNIEIKTIKNPKSLGRNDEEKVVIFEGTTREACKAFPRNVNVHAAVALAGLGFDKTKSTIISDPSIENNTHLIVIEGEGINFEIKISSKPVGKVTGTYTPISAFGSVQRILGNERNHIKIV